MNELSHRINHYFKRTSEQLDEQAHQDFREFRQLLDRGEIRAAEPVDGIWRVNEWVKKGILLGFRLGRLIDYSIDDRFRFYDMDTYPLKSFGVESRIRQVPGGSAIREGAYVAPSVIIMPPAYINVGAYVDANSLVDSHALVGSCAQVGKNVHVSAGCQIGGVLEPVGALPVIIEDEVMLGGNTGVYEGTIVRRGAVLAAGTILTSSTKVYDLVNERILGGIEGEQFEIPENAVVVPGARGRTGTFASKHGLSIYTPLIIKYRDASTEVATQLEGSLR